MTATEPTQKKQKHRGTIIVDTCIIGDLAFAVPKSIQGDHGGGKHLFDALVALANHGFKVIIPESSMYEFSGQLVVDGQLRSVNEYFKRPKGSIIESSNDRLKSLFEKDHLSRLFSKIFQGKIPNMEIVVTDASTLDGEAAEYITRIKDIIRNNPVDTSIEAGNKALVEAQRCTNKPTQLGDRIIERQLSALLHDTPEETHYILSNDYKLSKRIAYNNQQHRKNVNVLNINGLLSGLIVGKLLPEIGIEPSMTTHDIKHGVITIIKDIGGDRYFPRIELDSSINLVTTPQQNDYFVDDKPFMATMRSIAQEITTREAQQPTIGTTEHKAPSAMERFKKRFGRQHSTDGSSPSR